MAKLAKLDVVQNDVAETVAIEAPTESMKPEVKAIAIAKPLTYDVFQNWNP